MKVNKQYQAPTMEKVDWQEQDVIRTSFVEDTSWTDPPFVDGAPQGQGGDFE